MKILAATPLYPPSSRVGSWLSTHECVAHLATLGHEVRALRTLARVAPDYELDGVQVSTGPHRMVELTNWADAVISHLGDNGRAHRYAIRQGKPSIRMAHGGIIRDEQIAEATLVVWNAESYRAGRPGIVVHPPVHPGRYATTPGGMVTLVNLSEDKGVKTFWRAAELLPDVPFLGVKGATGYQLTPRAANVQVRGAARDMRDVYSRTRVLLMPSAYETWGRVAVEAMASGIPVIAHPTPGLREALGAAGIFLDRDDTTGWVREISKLIDRPSSWQTAAELALRRSAELDPADDLDRFAQAIEAFDRVAA